MELESSTVYLDENYWLDITYKVPELIEREINLYISDITITRKGSAYNLWLIISTGPDFEEVYVVPKPRISNKPKEICYTVYFPFGPYSTALSKIKIYIEHYFQAFVKVMEIENIEIHQGFLDKIEKAKKTVQSVAVGNPEYEINSDDDASKFVPK
jgi:hypothetical protein